MKNKLKTKRNRYKKKSQIYELQFVDNWELYKFLYLFNSTVFQEADSFGSMSDKVSWIGMAALVISGITQVGASRFMVTKERSEDVAFTDTLEFHRWDRLLYLLCSI